VKATQIEEMIPRINGDDVLLDQLARGDRRGLRVPALAEEQLAHAEEQHMIKRRINHAVAGLDERERKIIEKRRLTEDPKTLEELAEHFERVTRARASDRAACAREDPAAAARSPTAIDCYTVNLAFRWSFR
jgi:DNA-directed RNA polymerase sigma subunit (sigma70/sigma32)